MDTRKYSVWLARVVDAVERHFFSMIAVENNHAIHLRCRTFLRASNQANKPDWNQSLDGTAHLKIFQVHKQWHRNIAALWQRGHRGELREMTATASRSGQSRCVWI
jgi:hypothetical protein